VRRIVKLCLCREPSSEEAALLTRLHDKFAAQCRERPADAAKLLAGRKLAGTDDAEAAAWVAVARTVLNLDEFVTRE
jgi:hypothetical protein